MLVWKPCGFYSTRTDLSSVWRYVYIITFIQAIYRVCLGRHINLIMHLGLFVLTRATYTTIVNAQARTPLKTNQIRLSIANVSLMLTMASERYVYTYVRRIICQSVPVTLFSLSTWVSKSLFSFASLPLFTFTSLLFKL